MATSWQSKAAGQRFRGTFDHDYATKLLSWVRSRFFDTTKSRCIVSVFLKLEMEEDPVSPLDPGSVTALAESTGNKEKASDYSWAHSSPID